MSEDDTGEPLRFPPVPPAPARAPLPLLTAIVPVIGAVLPLARVGEAHELLEGGSSRGLRGKVAIDVVGQTVELPAPR